MSRFVAAAGLAAVVVLGAGCGGSGPDSRQSFNPPPPAPSSPAVRLSFPWTPGATAGHVMSPVFVYVLDAQGSQTSAAVTVTLTASVGDLRGTTTRVAAGGFATFDDLVLTRAGSTTLIATATGLTGTETGAFTVSAGPIASLTFETQPPAIATAGATLSDVKVVAHDSWGNLTGGNESVTLTIAGPPLLGTTTRLLEAGAATFSGLSVQGAGTGYVLSATTWSGPFPAQAVSSRPFEVLPASAERLVYGVQPWSVLAGELLVPAVEVRVVDAYGNLVSASREVTVATNTLGGATTVTTVGGIATFADLRATLAGWHDLVASADGLASASASFQVLPGSAAALDFVAQPPAAVTAGSLFSSTVSVAPFDAYGNRVSGDYSSVTLSVTGAELFGSPTAYLYRADFYNLSVRKAGTGYRLMATSSTGLAPGLSSPFEVVAGAAHHLGFTSQPASTTAGATLVPVSISALDGWGNATAAYGLVTIDFSPASSSAPPLYGTVTRSLVAGKVNFDDLSVRVAGQRYVLRARVNGGGLYETASDPFDILPGPPTQLAFLAQPAPAATRAGQPITPAIQVAMTDAWLNVAPVAEDRDVTLGLEPNADGAVLAGTTSVATVARVARFDGLTIAMPGTGFRLRASAAGLADALSSSFDVAPNWASIGPDGGDVTALAADPGASAVAYAAAGGCVWKTVDGAATWTRACRGLGLQAFQIDVLAVHPFLSQTVLAATSSGLYRSDDAGGTWSQVSSLGAATPYRTLSLAIAGSGEIYAGTYQDGLWRSDDGGTSWTRVGAGLPAARITAIAVEPASTEVLYVAGVDPTEVGTVYRSIDRGDTWSETALGPATVPGVKPAALLVDPSLADTIYVGTQTGVYESYDRGASFSQQLWGADVRDLAAYDAATHVRYAAGTSGLWRKTVGTGWAACTGLPASPKVAAVAVRADGSALAGTRYGPYQSTNQGVAWTSRTTGLRAFNIGAVGAGSLGAAVNATVYAATAGGGVYRSLNGGATWTRGAHPAEGQFFYGIAVERANPSRAWLAGASGLYRTTDAGATWIEVLTSQGTMFSTVLDPANDAIVYAGGNNDVYRSTAGTTASFRDLNVCSGTARALALSGAAPLALWVGGDAGLCRVDLARVNDVFVPYAFQLGTSGLTDAIAIDPDPALAGSTVWASTSRGFHTTLDGGATWTTTSGRFNALLAQRGKLFGAPSLGGVSLSRDGGVTFAPIGVGLPPACIVRALADVALRPDEIYAGTISGSVYKTTSGGE
jgi:photosystem II stability/assembly factor-like uncharacterized protein